MFDPQTIRIAKQSLYKRSFKHFVKAYWGVVCPAPYVEELPQEAIIHHLQAVADGTLGKSPTLVINVPPSSSKSLLCSVLFPAWLWTRDPSLSFICASHTARLVEKMAASFRNLVESSEYSSLFDNVKLSIDTNSKSQIRNTALGERISVSVGGSVTGYHGHIHLIDDLVDASDANNVVAIEAANAWFQQTLSTRWKDESRKVTIVIAQRLSTGDLPGLLIQQPGTVHLCLPAILDGAPCVTPVWADPRQLGEPLAPIRLPRASLDDKKVNLGTYGYSAQFQQEPVPTSGGVVNAEWLNHSYSALPAKFEKVSFIIDAANTGTQDPYAVLMVGLHQAKLYAIDYWSQAVDFPAALQKIEALKLRHCPTEICVEAASQGHALIQTFRQKWPNVIPLIPKGSKLERLSAATPQLEAGSFLFPEHADWLKAFKAEVVGFPRQPHDEAVDTLSYAINRYLVSNAASSVNWNPVSISSVFG